MEVSITKISVSLVFLVLATFTWRFLNWLWFRPRRLESYLRKQGFQGRPYRLLHGDIKESVQMLKQALSTTIDLDDDHNQRVEPFLIEAVKRYGKNIFTWIGPIPKVFLTNPEDIRDAFTKINEFRKTPVHPLLRLLISGLANHEGDKWTKHRKIINPAFHLEKIKMMVPVMHKSCNEMMERWGNEVSGKGWSEVDVWPHLQSLACDVIARTAFGSSYEEGRRIFELLKEQTYMTMQILQSVYIPGWRFLPTKTNRKMMAIQKDIEASLREIIKKRETAMEASEVGNEDLLGVLMESNNREMKEHKVGLSREDVVDECKLFFFAGQETTSVLLVWTMILLSKHKSWQERAREEVLRVLGEDHVLDFERLNHLKVLTMILNEVLRLYSPIAEITRRIDRPIQLGSSVKLPSSIFVSLSSTLVHLDHEKWGDDALEFNPERFAEGVSNATKNQLSFFPFGWGPRICIGQNFALIEAKMVVAMILQRFSFDLSPSYRHAPANMITVRPQYGAPIILRNV